MFDKTGISWLRNNITLSCTWGWDAQTEPESLESVDNKKKIKYIWYRITSMLSFNSHEPVETGTTSQSGVKFANILRLQVASQQLREISKTVLLVHTSFKGILLLKVAPKSKWSYRQQWISVLGTVHSDALPVVTLVLSRLNRHTDKLKKLNKRRRWHDKLRYVTSQKYNLQPQ